MTDRLPFGQTLRRHWVEVAWWAFVALNIEGILLLRAWATVPFHFIWISLALVYGWRVWSVRATVLVLGVVIVSTGSAMWLEVLAHYQEPDELTEIPLMAAVFLAMVWFVRRALAAREETARVSERNLMLLHREQRFLQDASHVLRTPLTIATGYTEMLQHTSRDPALVADLQVVVDELRRLARTTTRLLSLARAKRAESLQLRPVSAAGLVGQVARRWAGSGAPVRLGRVEDGSVRVDVDRVTEALDELVGNAVRHTPAGTPIELSCWYDEGQQVFVVADRGPGVPEEELATIFDRWTQGTGTTEGRRSGLGLGLAIVRAAAEAHHGTVTVTSSPAGTSFAMRLPARPAQPAAGFGMLTGRSNAE